MEEIDTAMERRVWDRVAGLPEQREDLRHLMQGAMMLADSYERLAARSSGRKKQLLRKLWQGEKENLACLRGLQRLRSGSCPKLRPLPPLGGENLLETCWHRTCRAAGDYAARMAEPESGVVFGEMSRREQQHLVLLSHLLGERPG